MSFHLEPDVPKSNVLSVPLPDVPGTVAPFVKKTPLDEEFPI